MDDCKYLKILYVIGAFFPAQSGGPCNTTYWAAKELVRRNVQVDIITFSNHINKKNKHIYGITFNKFITLHGIRVCYIRNIFPRFLSLLYLFLIFFRIKRYDLVSLTSVFSPFTWIAAVSCRINGVKYLIAPRGELDAYALRYSKIKKLISKPIVLKILELSEAVIVTSELERKYVLDYYSEVKNIDAIPNFFDLPNERIFSERHSPMKKRNILYLGRLHPKKNIESLIEAYCRLPSDLVGAHKLLIAGKGDQEYEASLRNLVAQKNFGDHVIFVGHVEGANKDKLLSDVKVLVLPSFTENFGNVVVEALGWGTPVIASSTTPWEQLARRKAGLWVCSCPDALEKAILEITSLSASRYRVLCSSARELAKDEYCADRNGGKILQVYRKHHEQPNSCYDHI